MGPDKIRFLLLSKEGPPAARIIEQLRTHPRYEVDHENAPREALSRMETSKIDCLILNIDQFSFRQFHLIEQIRKLGYKFQIFVFAEIVNRSAEDLVETLHNVIIFGKHYIDLDNDLLGICERFYRGQVPVKRHHKRKLTRTKGMIENPRTGLKFSCMVFNLSSGGAYIEFGAGQVTVNDEVTLRIHLARVGKTHVLKAQVMWVRTSRTGTRAAGLMFIK